MNNTKIRKYTSPAREEQARATRERIMEATMTLLHQKGFDGMTIAEIAARAEVSPQTVYAAFSSKAGIISASVENRILKDERNLDAIKLMLGSTDPERILRSAATITRNAHESNAAAFSAMYGIRMVSPQLAELEQELNEHRREKQTPIIESLMACGGLAPHLDKETARDILWALSGRELYALLVIRRGWSLDRYEEQLATLLIASLARKARPE